MSYEEISRQLETFLNEMREDRSKVHAGFKNPDFSHIRKKYNSLFSQESIDKVQSLLGTTTGRDARERMERLMFTLIEGIVEGNTLESIESIMKTKRRAEVNIDGKRIPFLELHRLMSQESDIVQREKLRAGYITLIQETEERRIETERSRRKALSTFGFGSYREYAETKKRINYEAFLDRSIPILEETTGLYRRVLTEVLKKQFGKGLGEMNVVHATWLFSGRQFDAHFPSEKLLKSCKSALEHIGLGLDSPSLSIDAEDRPTKHPRPLTVPVNVPREVHLLLQPHKGFVDYASLMHEAGHALHHTHTDDSLPMEWRMLPRDRALTETFAYTFEQLLLDPLWLEHGLHLSKDAAEEVSTWTLLRNLYLLRRHIAKFTFELSFDANPHDHIGAKKTYTETLKDLTGFVHEEETYLVDMDPVFQSADKIRAWIASAQLEEHLLRTYGERWFLKRETGHFFRQAFSRGDAMSCEEFISSLGMTPWDPLPLIRKFDGLTKLLR